MCSSRPSPLAALRLLALLVAVSAAIAGAAAAGSPERRKPDPGCRTLCQAKARTLLLTCVEGGEPRDTCRRKARGLRSACAAHECVPSCVQRCEILGLELFQDCLEDSGELESCRTEADLARDACIEQRCRPCVCPDIHRPVCGVDGITYGNACEAGCAGVDVLHDGPCEPRCPPLPCDISCPHGLQIGPGGCPICACNFPPGCRTDEDCGEGQMCHQLCSLRPCLVDDPDCAPCVGVCLPRREPCPCPQTYAPVCGIDGKTYWNPCRADCAGVEVAHEGECRRECTSNADCEHRQVCDPPSRTCQPRCVIQCFRYDPVCGTDGVTYGCGAADAHCHGVEVAHEGECRPSCGPNQSCQ